MTTRDLQTILTRLGFDPGPIDGVYGRRTIAAIKAFQHSHGLAVDGVVGPKTLAALLDVKSPSTTVAAGLVGVPWFEELLRRKGLHETRDRSALMAWLRSDGRTLGDPSVLPWCGDAIATCIALTLPEEPMPSNPYLARNWLQFGQPLKVPTLGAIGVAQRGTGIQGHVFLYVGETPTHYRAAGGNQRDAITDDALIAKGRVLGWRWPTTVPQPLGGRIAAAGGTLSTNEA